MAFLDHEGAAEFSYARDDVFDAIVEAIPTIRGIRVESTDRLAGRIVAKAGVSLFSWGETIPISVVALPAGGTRVTVVSTPKTGVLFGGAFDMGKNRQNVEGILSAASEMLASRAPATSRPPKGIEERLAKLKELHEAGHISDDDFGRRKNEILSEI